jgi:hypothetical protein
MRRCERFREVSTAQKSGRLFVEREREKKKEKKTRGMDECETFSFCSEGRARARNNNSVLEALIFKSALELSGADVDDFSRV